MQKFVLIPLFLVGILIVLANAAPERKRKLVNPGLRIFHYLDKKSAGKIPTAEVKAEVQKLLPLSNAKNIDPDNDGFVSKKEFREFYEAQFEQWKKTTFKSS